MLLLLVAVSLIVMLLSMYAHDELTEYSALLAAVPTVLYALASLGLNRVWARLAVRVIVVWAECNSGVGCM